MKTPFCCSLATDTVPAEKNAQPYAVTADIAQLDAVAEEARFYALAPLEQQCEQAMARLRELEAAQVFPLPPSPAWITASNSMPLCVPSLLNIRNRSVENTQQTC